MPWFQTIRPLLFRLDPEIAHRFTVNALKMMPILQPVVSDKALAVNLAGLCFPNPVGLAAGFDKNAEVPSAMLDLGFGFVEIGTITPIAQSGNAKPRLFRLAEDDAIINRMGFNNGGHAAAYQRLKRVGPNRGIIGVNIGANKESTDRIADYVAGVRTMAEVASYLTINISSPNTPGLRGLQDKSQLLALLDAARAARGVHSPPLFLKLAPDLDLKAIDDIAAVAVSRVDALIISNTTISRPPLLSRFGSEAGGLSGAPLASLAHQQLREFRSATGGKIPLIAVGGIASAEDAYARIRSGASLVQLYSALVFKGPGLAKAITRGLKALLQRDGFANIGDAIGVDSR